MLAPHCYGLPVAGLISRLSGGMQLTSPITHLGGSLFGRLCMGKCVYVCSASWVVGRMGGNGIGFAHPKLVVSSHHFNQGSESPRNIFHMFLFSSATALHFLRSPILQYSYLYLE